MMPDQSDVNRVDIKIVNILEEEGIGIVCTVPCQMLAGILNRISQSRLTHLPVTREEEGVGILAGAYLGGLKPALIMQNSGLGNCINALLSLTRLYRIPLLMILSHRGGGQEKIEAQVPMGRATPDLLRTLDIDFVTVEKEEDLAGMRKVIQKVFQNKEIGAILLSRELWNEKN